MRVRAELDFIGRSIQSRSTNALAIATNGLSHNQNIFRRVFASSDLHRTLPLKDTTQKKDLDLKAAGFWVRFLAMVYDTIVVIGIWVFTIVLLVTIRGDAVIGFWVQSLLFVELFAFFSYFWAKRGQTVGMQAWRLRLVSNQPITPQMTLKRFVAALVGGLFLFLGYLWILVDKQNRSWSDILSNSYIVREPKKIKSN